MNRNTDNISLLISEVYQSVFNTNDQANNIFHRPVIKHDSTDLSFINGIAETGLRSSAYVPGNQLMSNYEELLYASRQHIPLVIHTDSHSLNTSKNAASPNFNHIYAVQSCGFFQFVAGDELEWFYLTLAAHKIAETSLIPGMVIKDFVVKDEQIPIPASAKLIQFLGSPDDRIPSPTPAQQILFGLSRRRVPNWFSPDLPAMLAPLKDETAIGFEAAARERFFYAHLPAIIEQVFGEIKTFFGYDLQALKRYGESGSYGLLMAGGANDSNVRIIRELKKTDVARLVQWSPLPLDALQSFIRGKQSVSLLEPVYGELRSRSTLQNELIAGIGQSKTSVYTAKYQGMLNAEKIKLAYQHMINQSNESVYYLGLEFTRNQSKYPKHEVLLQELASKYPGIEKDSIGKNDVIPGKHDYKETILPLALSQLKEKGPNYSQLAKFNDQTAVFYGTDHAEELIADPFAAVPSVPRGSAALFALKESGGNTVLADMSKCTACGACFTYCPQSAIHPMVAGVEQWMKTGMDLAALKGLRLSRLTPMLKNLSKIAGAVYGDNEGLMFSDLVTPAFDKLCKQMNITGDSYDEIKGEFRAVLDEIGDLQVALTDTFYHTPNAREKGNGELFSLSIDPETCTACGLCEAICADDAIRISMAVDQAMAKARKHMSVWTAMPDVKPDTMQGLFQGEDYNALSSVLLSRNYANTLTGTSAERNEDPVKQMVRLITASAESVVQPKVLTLLKQVDDLVEKLSAQIRDNFQNALPDDSLDRLSDAIRSMDEQKLSYKQIFDKFQDDGQSKLIDRSDMQRKLDLLDALRRLKWLLEEGPSGLGRSRFGLLIDSTGRFDWASQYPLNPFLNPVSIRQNGNIAGQALGLFQGQLRFILDNYKLIRRANLEVAGKYDESLHDPIIAKLSWEELSKEEKMAVPPIIIITEHAHLLNNSWAGIFSVISGDFPVKIMAFNGLMLTHGKVMEDIVRTNSSIWSLIGTKQLFMYQGSLAQSRSLSHALMDGLSRSAPALFHLYVHSPEFHDQKDPNWTNYSVLANSSRMFPEFLYDPSKQSDYLHGAVVLDNNPGSGHDWVRNSMSLNNGDSFDYDITCADWIFTYPTWRNEFEAEEYKEAFIPVSAYIGIKQEERADRVPVILKFNEDGLQYYTVSQKVINITELVLNQWRSLQEFAGLISPFAGQIRKEAAESSAFEFEEKIREIKNQHASEISNLEAQYLEKIRLQLKQKLVALSKMAKN